MKKLIALLLASTSAGWGSPGGAQAPTTPADYAATFKNADIGCCIVRDVFHKSPQAMAKGRAGVGETAVWDAKDNALQMKLTAPATIRKDGAGNIKVPSMGIFGTGYCLGAGSNFAIKGTFQKPIRDVSPDSWTVTVVARTGDVADIPDLGRLQLSLRVSNGRANLRVLEGTDNASTAAIPGAKKDVTGAAYKEIYTLHEPFILTLSANRQTGFGTATLTTKSQTIAIPFTMGVFTKDAGSPTFTTVGAALANTGPKLKATVEVAGFELWAPLCAPVP
jgi:hypothetical protein